MSEGFTRGSPEYRRVAVALFAAGFATFALLYSVQPLMPLFAARFGLNPADSSLALSFSTAALALSLLAAGAMADRVGRKTLMTASLFASAALTVVAALAPNWPMLLVARTLLGVALAGVPAIAMTYLAEEAKAEALGSIMGLYVGGTAVGGMSGRLLSGLLADFTGDWRMAVGGVGLAGLAAAVAFVKLLPPSRRFHPRAGLTVRQQVRDYAASSRTPGLPWLLLCGFCLMGGFVTLYNYVGFRLLGPPFHLSHAAVALIFLVYLAGVPASPFFGSLGGRVGRGPVLAAAAVMIAAGAALTLSHSVALTVLGVAVLTAGFFGGHALASGWVGRLAGPAKAQAASLYLLFYYAGSSLVGSSGGHVFSAGGWGALIMLVSGLAGLVLLAAWRLNVVEQQL
ncbi:MFS transporter [Caulobacter sp. NIBR2454]|uniref:MFS transporter n=1 Tax=Caulobacter sp. NIBR2454 TaxID=3015996 RepID=UPI0022B71C96|nr:MFS transporter [Caulobacter sp. NIBR2454]